MLATDGRDSFALFIYNDSESVINLTSHDRIVGFIARNEETSIVLNSGSSDGTLAGINIFRIDGKMIYSIIIMLYICNLFR